MRANPFRPFPLALLLAAALCWAAQRPAPPQRPAAPTAPAQAARGRGAPAVLPADLLSRAFASGYMLLDTNQDGLDDAIQGKIVVPAAPSAAENAAAANLAARLAYGSTGLTPPLVVTAADPSARRSPEASSVGGPGPRFYVGAAAAPAALQPTLQPFAARLAKGEGLVVALDGNLAVLGFDDDGLLAAADAFSARAPYQWQTPGAAFSAIAAAVNAAAPAARSELVALQYFHNGAGIEKAYLRHAAPLTAAQLQAALVHLPEVHALVALGSPEASAINPKVFVPAVVPAAAAAADRLATPAPAAATGNDAASDNDATGGTDTPAAPAAGAGRGGAAGGPAGLDLASLYAARGLFNPAGRVPVPASLNAHLYVPAGAAGTAMANLAARMGLESTGITLPLASPAAPAVPPVAGGTPSEALSVGGPDLAAVPLQPVVAGDSPLAQAIEKKLLANDTAAAASLATPLAPGEGELRIVDQASGPRAALLVRGDAVGSAAALDLAANHFPNLDQPGKQFLSLEDIRYDLHQFFFLHSGVGQSAAGVYFLDQWMKQIAAAPGSVSNVKAELYADLADPQLAVFLQQRIQDQLHVPADVAAASLRAGTQCCDANPDLHYSNPAYPFHQGTPVFAEDIKIPWEGNTLLDDVRGAAPNLHPGQPLTLVARVSEGPAERQKLADQIRGILAAAGVAPAQQHVEVLSAYKQGYSWLEDEIAPALASLPVARIRIDFAKDVDETGMRVMYSPARWVQELYPVDEVLAKKLNIPVANITLNQIDTAAPLATPQQIALGELSAPPANPAPSPTYIVHAFDASGKEILTHDFTVSTVMQPYNGVIRAYEDVQVETGWIRLEQSAPAGAPAVLLDQRIPTDIEQFWDHYQNVTLPRVYRFIMAQSKGNLRSEYAPPFDTLKMDFHLSEPDYNIGIDKERISSIEALQEDVFYSTETFVDALGDLESGHPETYVGRIIPVMHPSEDGRDGLVHIEFYGKAAANPVVRLSWTDAQGKHQERERNLPVLAGDFQPRLIDARVQAGKPGATSLTWLLPADFKDDDMADWVKVEGREQLERSIFSVQQARGELRALDQMHAAGLYPDELAYPDLQHLGVELQLPRPIDAPFSKPEERILLSWNVAPPAHPRPMIADIPKIATPPGADSFVQWNEPIAPAENAAILARLASYPGVNAYWMGRSYLGENIWAADIMLPSPSQLRSWAKETTEKASIVYSGRQHANEVSSTSHIDRLGELLVTDPEVRAYLKQVNVVLHPIDNPDGAQLSVIEAKIVPDYLLHLGYHGALAADVSAGQAEIDPIYPESRTRRLLLQQWNPDAFLNPHGYPSHEWVQPFSEYSAWVQSRAGANGGRTWWIPRGWFTSLSFARDTSTNTYSQQVTFALRDRIVASERAVPGLLPLETRMNDRYQRWGQAFQPDNMQQPLTDGIRIYMSLKGGAGGAGGQAGPGTSAAITWDQGYTEAPDETAHGDYMKLVASAGLAYDEVHLKYLALGKLRITRTERETPAGVAWTVDRQRPILPSSEPPISKPAAIAPPPSVAPGAKKGVPQPK